MLAKNTFSAWREQWLPKPVLWGLAAWFILNTLQAIFSPLDPDEAYYWMYARQLDWGYYDHPPMVAILVSLGKNWLPAEWGLRWGNVLVATATLYALWCLAERPRGQAWWWLLLLMASMPMLQIYGFIATPDAPLLFATLLFWLALRHFSAQPKASSAGWLALTMALLLFSKYHGVLIIGFSLLANIKLWRQPWLYPAGILALLLFSPHLWWQWQNDFPSFRYHLSGRDDPYELKHTLNYLVNQLTIFNPLLLPWWAPLVWRWRPQGTLQRAMLGTCLGFWLFFLWSTTKGHTEPQWNAVLSFPIIWLLWQHWSNTKITAVWPGRLALASLALLLLLRIVLALPGESPLRQFNHQAWINTLEERAGDHPVWFENSYRDASLYAFYTGKPAWTFTNIVYRHNQFDLWDDAQQWQNQTVAFTGSMGWDCLSCDTLVAGKNRRKLLLVDSLQIPYRTTIKWMDVPTQWRAGDTLALKVQFFHPYPTALQTTAGNLPLHLMVIASTAMEKWEYWPVTAGQPVTILPNQTSEFTLQVVVPSHLPSGPLPIALGWQYQGLPPMRNSPFTSVVIE